MNKKEKFHNGMSFEMNNNVELNDDELDAVAGGVTDKDLQAFWDAGYQGAPICTRHFNRDVVMISYMKNGQLHLECPECGLLKVIS
jgi:hypothetical protein